MVDIKEIKAQLKRAGMTQTELARSVEMDPSTLNRKINNSEGETLTVKEATQIAETLKIPRDMLTNIFLLQDLRKRKLRHSRERSARDEKEQKRTAV